MPADAVPFVVAIVAFFATFIIAVGGVSLWVALPTPEGRTRRARQGHRPVAAPMVRVAGSHRGT